MSETLCAPSAARLRGLLLLGGLWANEAGAPSPAPRGTTSDG
jgi:hypothetical protein